MNAVETPLLSPIIIARLVNTSVGVLFTNLQNFYLVRIQVMVLYIFRLF